MTEVLLPDKPAARECVSCGRRIAGRMGRVFCSDRCRMRRARLTLKTVREDAVERAARAYSRYTHANLSGESYREREEARDRLLDALAELDAARGLA